jgi:CheY-like chemotaxis protein
MDQAVSIENRMALALGFDAPGLFALEISAQLLYNFKWNSAGRQASDFTAKSDVCTITYGELRVARVKGRMIAIENGPVVLIIEDSATVRASIRLWVKFNFPGCGCLEAANGLEGLALALERQPEVILVDIELPEMNGLDVVRHVKKQAPQIRIVVLSMHEDKSLEREIRRAGANAYVPKGRIGEQLYDVVAELLSEFVG